LAIAALHLPLAKRLAKGANESGSSNVRMVGCTIFVVYGFALNVAPTFTKQVANSAVV
jgi:hypothetical protein